MARTAAEIQLELNRRKFPCDVLDDDDMQGVIDAALREFDKAQPLIVFASFTTKVDQIDWFIFDPTDADTHIPDPDNIGQFLALCADAQAVRDVYWNPGGDWSSLNLFSPGWQLLSQVIIFTGSYFHQPSQLTILRQKLDTWKRQFGSQGFEVIGEPGRASSFLRIYPIPKEAGGKVIVEYTKGHTLATIDKAYERFLQQWIEAYYAESMANYYSQTSGVKLLGFENSADALRYWERRATVLRQRAVDTQLGPHGEVERS